MTHTALGSQGDPVPSPHLLEEPLAGWSHGCQKQGHTGLVLAFCVVVGWLVG